MVRKKSAGTSRGKKGGGNRPPGEVRAFVLGGDPSALEGPPRDPLGGQIVAGIAERTGVSFGELIASDMVLRPER